LSIEESLGRRNRQSKVENRKLKTMSTVVDSSQSGGSQERQQQRKQQEEQKALSPPAVST